MYAIYGFAAGAVVMSLWILLARIGKSIEIQEEIRDALQEQNRLLKEVLNRLV